MTETTMPVQMISSSEALAESCKKLELKREAAKEAILKRFNEAATHMSPIGTSSDHFLRTQFGVGHLVSAVTLSVMEEPGLLSWLVDEARSHGYLTFCRSRLASGVCDVYFAL